MKPPLLLHICCAPDEAWVVHTLRDIYKVHCFFCNPNISPQKEYKHRLEEASHVAELYQVPFSVDLYLPELWEHTVLPYRTTPEGGERCRHCIALRLDRSAAECKKQGIPSFTSVMSVSPHKKIKMLNDEGTRIAEKYGLTWLPFDFKKKNGFLNSIHLSNQLGLYRQDYCGCFLSRNERNERNRQKKGDSFSVPPNG